MLVVITAGNDYEKNRKKKNALCVFIILVKSHMGQNLFTVGKCIDGCNSQNSTICLACGDIDYYPFSIWIREISCLAVLCKLQRHTNALQGLCILLYYSIAWLWCCWGYTLASLDLNACQKWPHSSEKCVDMYVCWSRWIRPEQEIYIENWTTETLKWCLLQLRSKGGDTRGNFLGNCQ